MTKIQVNSQGKAYLTTAGKALVSAQPTLVSKSITENGTYNASSDNADGYSSVTVNVSGGGGSTKYGCTIDNLLGNVDANGVLQTPTAIGGDIIFSGVKDIKRAALGYRFAYNESSVAVSFPDIETLSNADSLYYGFCYSNINGVSFPKLSSVSGNSALNSCFYSSKVSSVSFPELLSITGTSATRNMFAYDESLTTASFPKLKTATGFACMGAMFQATSITTLSFPELDNIGDSVMLSMLSSCKTITDLYFNSLKTTSFGSYVNQFANMFNSSTASTSGAFTMHFPSNLSSTISGLTGYPNFGASSGRLTLAFDLPATT